MTTLLTTLALTVSGLGVSIGFAGTAHAADCNQQTGTAKRDPNTGWSWTTWWNCGNDRGAKMYRDPNTTTHTAYMDTSPSWFVCWKRGASHAGGNNVWYYSQGDRSAPGQSARHAWGFMPAVNVHTSTDPWPGMAECPSTTTPPPPGPPARADGIRTLLLVHGYDMQNDGINCGDYWGKEPTDNYLHNRGWAGTGKVVKLTYYAKDGTNCLKIANSSGLNKPIEDIGADLAWFIYNTYSSRNLPVDVIAHSMGGLVMRTAIAGTANGLRTASGRTFPPYLYVEDVATLSTPHHGTYAPATLGCVSLTTHQCVEMAPQSTFLSSWIDRYPNPQSGMGTDWSAIGSGADLIVSSGSAMNMWATSHFGHKYLYLSSGNLGHSAMSEVFDGSRPVQYCDYFASCNMANATNWPQANSPGPIAVAANAAYFASGW
jgi:hypothetical protein